MTATKGEEVVVLDDGGGVERVGIRPSSATARRDRQRKRLRSVTRNKKSAIGGVLTLSLVAIALCAPWLAPYEADRMGATELYAKPSAAHWFGGDEFGRDLLSRILLGVRISIGVSVVVTLVSATIGGSIGLVAGLSGGRIDGLLGSVIDLLFGIPAVLLALFTATVLGPGLRTVVVALCIVYVPQFARVFRAAAISIKSREFIVAARASGAYPWQIAYRHILPNCLPPVLVHGALVMSLVILDEAALAFIGIGTQPPTPSWGIILRQGLDYLSRTPYTAIIAGIAIFLAVFSFNMLADGLRDQLDPRLKNR
jgi:peptide/nickel transport system permease protein